MNVKKNLPQPYDYIFIENLEAACRLGITSQERAFPQIITLSIKLFFSLQKAGQTDNLRFSVDYAETIQEVKELIESSEYKLIESVAERIASQILKTRDIQAAEVKAMKKVFAGIGSVGACIYRTSTIKK